MENEEQNITFESQPKNVIEKGSENPDKDKRSQRSNFSFQQNIVGALAEEIAKTVVARLPKMLPKRSLKKTKSKKIKKIENGIFLDTSAIIDGRIFDVIALGIFTGIFVIPESILLELKHIADSQDTIKRERGRGGLEALEKLKKMKKIKLMILSQDRKDDNLDAKKKEVDEILIILAKHHKGKIITCDYNLEKKATIHGITAININALAQCLKISAVPGESLHIKVLHQGKDLTQGVGYLDDGTMIVIEDAKSDLGKMLDVVVSRVIQTASGRILFAKKIN